MALKDEWKQTGTGLGHAFKGLGRNVVRSVKAGVDALEEPEKTEEEKANEEPKSTVFNDGSWRNTGKELGHAFKGLGKSIIDSAQVGIEKLEEDSPAEDKK